MNVGERGKEEGGGGCVNRARSSGLTGFLYFASVSNRTAPGRPSQAGTRSRFVRCVVLRVTAAADAQADATHNLFFFETGRN